MLFCSFLCIKQHISLFIKIAKPQKTSRLLVKDDKINGISKRENRNNITSNTEEENMIYGMCGRENKQSYLEEEY